MRYYAVSIRVEFGVMADSSEEAERIASKFTEGMAGEIPITARVVVDAYLTPNQARHIQREAVNFENAP